MGETLNKRAWCEMIDDDMQWLHGICKHTGENISLEYRHTVACLEWLRNHEPECAKPTDPNYYDEPTRDALLKAHILESNDICEWCKKPKGTHGISGCSYADVRG